MFLLGAWMELPVSVRRVWRVTCQLSCHLTSTSEASLLPILHCKRCRQAAGDAAVGKQLPSTPGAPRSPMTPLASNRLRAAEFDTVSGGTMTHDSGWILALSGRTTEQHDLRCKQSLP
jgi:hypothetical protein